MAYLIGLCFLVLGPVSVTLVAAGHFVGEGDSDGRVHHARAEGALASERYGSAALLFVVCQLSICVAQLGIHRNNLVPKMTILRLTINRVLNVSTHIIIASRNP